MLLFNVEEYKSNKYVWPTANIDPEEKRKHNYVLGMAQSIYHAYVTDKTAIPVNTASRFNLLRLYGKGKQPTEQYKDALLSEDNSKPDQLKSADFKSQKRKAWLNVDFQHVISAAQKIKDHFHGIFHRQDMDIIASAIDEDSGMMMKDKKHEIQTELLFAKELGRLRELAGEEPPKMDFFPLDQAELEDFEASGGFKLNFSKAMEKLLKHTFSLSKYNQLKKMWIDDAIDLGIVAGRIGEDSDTEETIVDYVDPVGLIVQWSRYPDFRDAEYAGEIKPRTISELAQHIDDRDELARIAKHYSGKMGNPSIDYWENYNTVNNLGGWGYDFYRVPVLEGYYVDFEDEYEKEYTDKYGKRKVIPTRYGYKKKNNNEKVRVKRTRYLYKFNWVVDTNTVFDYGRAHNQERKEKTDVELPYRVMQVSENSIIDRLIPVFDDMMFSWLKYQNAQIMAANAGYAVNTRLLKNVYLGKKQADPTELLKMMIETGFLFYSDGDEDTGEGYTGGAVQPVQELMGGMRNQLEESISKFRFALEIIEQETGLSNLALGGTQQQEQSATASQLSVSAAQNIIRPVIDGVMDLKGNLGESVMYNIQKRLVKEDKLRDRYAQVIGRKDLQAVMDANERGARFGVHFRPRPTDQEVAEIKQWIQGLTSAGKNGQPLLQADEALMILEQLNDGANLADIRFKVRYKIRRREMEQAQQARAAEQREFQRNMAYRQQDTKSKLAQQNAEAQKEIQLKQLDNQNNLKVERLKANSEYEQLVLRLAGDEQKLQSEEYRQKLEVKRNG
jgi:hypothetical protein